MSKEESGRLLSTADYRNKLDLIADAVRGVLADREFEFQRHKSIPECGIVLRGGFGDGSVREKSDLDFQVLIDGKAGGDLVSSLSRGFGNAISDKLAQVIKVDPTYDSIDITNLKNMTEMLSGAKKVTVIYKHEATKKALQPTLKREKVSVDWIAV